MNFMTYMNLFVYYWRRWGIGRRWWKRRVWEWILERQKSCGVGWAWVKLRIQENIHVKFAGRELATTQFFVWSVVGGSTKDVVAFQESWRVMLISIVGSAWRVRMTSFSQFCWKRLGLRAQCEVWMCSQVLLFGRHTWGGRRGGGSSKGHVLGQSWRSYLLS